MYYLLIFFHVLVAVLLILVVLIQQPQKGGLGTVLGGESVFGGGGAAPFMAKLTSALAIAFMLTSIGLVLLTPKRSSPESQGSRDIKVRMCTVKQEATSVRSS
ncbi:MAG: preprotein translocase subunit SecG [candidate division WOR-3 bacterium]